MRTSKLVAGTKKQSLMLAEKPMKYVNDEPATSVPANNIAKMPAQDV
jgi:hypothetical protein